MAYDLTHVGNVIARSMVFQMTVSLVVLGIQLFMCIYGLTVFLETPKSSREGRAPYLAISFLLFVLLTTSSLMDVSYLFRLLFDSTSPMNFMYLRERTNDWVGFASQVLTNVVCFVGDGLLLYRCYIMWFDRRWVVVLPAMAYIASVVFGILAVLPMIKDISRGDANLSYMSLYITLSVVLNLLVTILISSRLVFARRRLASILPDSKGPVHYTGVIAILIESAIPLSVFGLALAVVLGISHSGDPDLLEKEIANYVFSSLYFSFAALSPQMIIFRVTTGRSWVSDFTRGDSASGAVSKDIAFARSQGYSCDLSTTEGQDESRSSEPQFLEKVMLLQLCQQTFQARLSIALKLNIQSIRTAKMP